MKQQVSMRFDKCIVRIIQTYCDSETEGYTDHEDKLLGFGKFEVPAEDAKGMLDYYGEEYLMKDMGLSDEFDYYMEYPSSDITSTNPDLFIHWAHYIVNHHKRYTVEIACEHIFWPIHDFFHSINDFTGTTFYCSPRQELYRFRQAYGVLKRRKIPMDPEYLERIVDTFNKERWGCYGQYACPRRLIEPKDISRPKSIQEEVL